MIETSRLFSRVVIASVVGLIGVFAITAVFMRARFSSNAKTDPAMVSADWASGWQGKGKARGPVQTVRFTVYDVGIYPRHATARSGLVAIAIEDLSGGTSGVAVTTLKGGEAVRVGVVEPLQNKRRGRSEMRLEPGHYEIFDLGRPDNRAELSVEP